MIIFGSSRLVSKIDRFRLPQVIMDDAHIEISDNVKNLGILIDRQLFWVPELAETSRKLFVSAAFLPQLRWLRNFLPIVTKIAHAQTLLPILDYVDVCYLDLTEEHVNKLERLQNFCIELKWLFIRLPGILIFLISYKASYLFFTHHLILRSLHQSNPDFCALL